jgi:hypothetical protein
MPTPAGWYPDPGSSGFERYWDGMQWTEHARPAITAPNGLGVNQAPAVDKVLPFVISAIATLCCCVGAGLSGVLALPTLILAWVNASKVESHLNAGDVAAAASARKKSIVFASVTLGITAVLTVVALLLGFFMNFPPALFEGGMPVEQIGRP